MKKPFKFAYPQKELLGPLHVSAQASQSLNLQLPFLDVASFIWFRSTPMTQEQGKDCTYLSDSPQTLCNMKKCAVQLTGQRRHKGVLQKDWKENTETKLDEHQIQRINVSRTWEGRKIRNGDANVVRRKA